MMVEAMMAGVLKCDADAWNILVVERDVPCAAIAIDDFKDKYEHLSALAGCKASFPTINLSIVSTPEFAGSPLHKGHEVLTATPAKHFDLCMDVSMLLRNNIDALPLKVDAAAVYIIRSSHYRRRARTICTTDNIVYPPFVEKDSAGSYKNNPEREELLAYFLRDIFRKASFRPGQLPILSHILADRTTIGLLPTGGGKSLTYQLSCLLQPGVSIVVDPLVSLIVDQVRGLHDARIDACDCVHSNMKAPEKTEKLNRLQNGNVLFMLLSPERFMMKNFRSSLQTMTEKNRIYFSYGIIDEVHCVSEWGHDFRPSYLHLGRNMIKHMQTKSPQRQLSVIGLTATASFDVLADVERELTLGGELAIDSETIVRPESDTRPELTYRILRIDTCLDNLKTSDYLLDVHSFWDIKKAVARAKMSRLAGLLSELPQDICYLNENESEATQVAHIPDFAADDFFEANAKNHYDNAGIIFCPHATGPFGVLEIAPELTKQWPGMKIGTFMGGDKLTPKEKALMALNMAAFNQNEQNLMVATKAFGMGIDKPNVRYVVHINYPSSIEGYVQEAGRGGRDKKHAISYVLYDSSEYIELTADKINDIRYWMGEDDPGWLENYKNRFVLAKDIEAFCKSNGASDKQAGKIMGIIRENGFLKSVDKENNLYFHNNSFRGLDKEKTILYEFTDHIMTVPNHLTELQSRLREMTGNDDVLLRIKINVAKKTAGIALVAEEGDRYGYISLDRLKPNYDHIDFDIHVCSQMCNSLLDLLNECPDHSADYLLQPIRKKQGLYEALENADENGCATVLVSWENSLCQDSVGFQKVIGVEIARIAKNKGWNGLEKNLDLSKISDFDKLIEEIAKQSKDDRWLRYHGHKDIFGKLQNIFWQKRDKNDTDKAIYRMCLLGIVEDVTIDYLSQTYELKVRRRTDEEYKEHMRDFFLKYYSKDLADRRVNEIEHGRGRNYLDKCIGYLTAFVYENLEKKRRRAIEDMQIACEYGAAHRQADGNDDRIKEFIHLYFNSKYARSEYEVNGKPYSLKYDTDTEGKNGFDVVAKYIEVIDPSIDNSGSEINNAKHLYGATLLCLRAHPDNAALQLLLSYCIAILGVGNNETLKKSAFDNYKNGFMALYDSVGNKVWGYIDTFNARLAVKIRPDDDYVRETLIDNGKNTIVFLVHEAKFNDIINK